MSRTGRTIITTELLHILERIAGGTFSANGRSRMIHRLIAQGLIQRITVDVLGKRIVDGGFGVAGKDTHLITYEITANGRLLLDTVRTVGLLEAIPKLKS